MIELAHAEGAKAELEMLAGGLNVRLQHLNSTIESLRRRVAKTAPGGPTLIVSNEMPKPGYEG